MAGFAGPSDMLLGVPLKLVSLVTLTFQNSALILIMHYSRVMPMPTTHRYFASTAVFLNEVLKLALCLIVAWRDRRKLDGTNSSIWGSIAAIYSEVFRTDAWKLAIPACLYTLQNRLQYVAVSNLDAATFQVTYQLKILTTALFTVVMLRRPLNSRQWISLVLLTIGVAIVQLPSHDTTPKTEKTRRSATYDGIQDDVATPMNRTVGLIAVVIACGLSGLAGVYFEKVLKGSNTSLWIRNIQLSFYSIIPALLFGVIAMDGREIKQRGFFDGYSMVVWTAIAFQAFGGIVVALCVAYADNIAKNFATSISILLSCIASIYFFDFVLTLNFLIGSSVVLFATYLYSKPDTHALNELNYHPLEKTIVDGGGPESELFSETSDKESSQSIPR